MWMVGYHNYKKIYQIFFNKRVLNLLSYKIEFLVLKFKSHLLKPKLNLLNWIYFFKRKMKSHQQFAKKNYFCCTLILKYCRVELDNQKEIHKNLESNTHNLNVVGSNPIPVKCYKCFW
jgi:hypothetical protein